MLRIPFKVIISFFFSILCMMPLLAQAEGLNLFVSVVPQKYFVQQIGKSRVNVHVMVPPGASPATYEPKPSQMVQLADADAYFAIGVPFEKAWLNKIIATNADMRVVHTDHGIEKRTMAGHDHHEHDGHDHEDSELDPHIWTAPSLVMIQAQTILRALQELDPAHAQEYALNYKAFVQELEALDKELREALKPFRGQAFMVFHPSWGYFADTYGLRQVPVELQGKAPKPAQLKSFIEQARSQNIRVVFVQPQFSKKSAELIAASIGGRTVVADPLAADWAANLRRQAVAIQEALR